MNIKALILDFSRVLIFANADVPSLNRHHNDLQAQIPGYHVLDHFRLNLELLDYLKQLSVRIPLYIFSDGKLHTLPEIAKPLEGIFKKIVTASEVGYKKSQPEAFLALAYRLGYAPSELLFIDDQATNIFAAKVAGFVTHQYTTNTELIGLLNNAAA